MIFYRRIHDWPCKYRLSDGFNVTFLVENRFVENRRGELMVNLLCVLTVLVSVLYAFYVFTP